MRRRDMAASEKKVNHVGQDRNPSPRNISRNREKLLRARTRAPQGGGITLLHGCRSPLVRHMCWRRRIAAVGMRSHGVPLLVLKQDLARLNLDFRPDQVKRLELERKRIRMRMDVRKDLEKVGVQVIEVALGIHPGGAVADAVGVVM